MSAEVEVYSFHDRVWHWIQALAILGLLGTGFALRFPELLPSGDLQTALDLHLGLAAFLCLNACLGLAYFVFGGAIRNYVPRPREVFTLALLQAHYYLWGIFRGAPHPFQKRPGARLNALQQLTYLAILNLLLPLQVVTGLLIWLGWSRGAAAPTHALGAWLFGSFVVLHLYLTTTGETPLANLRAMVTGREALSARCVVAVRHPWADWPCG